MSTIFLSTHGTNGDVLPFLRLATALRDRGHDVLLMTHAPFARRAQALGVDAIAIDDDEAYERHLVEAGSIMRTSLGGFDAEQTREFYRRNRFFEMIELEYAAIQARHVPGDTVVVGRHTSSLTALLAMEKLGLPSVWIAMNPSQYGTLPISEFTHEQVLAPSINELRMRLDLAPVHDWAKWLRSANVHIGLWPQWYDEAGTPAPDGVELAGFLIAEDRGGAVLPPNLRELFAGEIAPILVAGTSGHVMHNTYFSAAIGAAVLVGRPVVVATPYADNVPTEYADQVTWFERLPFQEVLPHFAAIVHHGGIGTAAAAAAAGTPQVILAQAFDQPDNGTRVTRAGLGTWLPAVRWSQSAVRAAIERALSPHGGPTQRYAFDTVSTVDLVCTRIEQALTLAPVPVPG